MTRAATAVPLIFASIVLIGAGRAASPESHREPRLRVEPVLRHWAAEVQQLGAPLALPTDHAPRIVFAGDSVAATLAAGLVADAAARGGSMRVSVRAGCGMLRGLPTTRDGYTPPWAAACDRAVQAWRAEVARAPADLVLVLSTWDGSPRLLDGVFVDPATAEGRATMVALVREVVDAIAPPASGRTVVFLSEAIPANGATTGGVSPERVIEARLHRAVLRAVARDDSARVRVVDLGRWLCPADDPCPEVIDGVRPRPNDGGHFSPEGSAWLAPRLLDAVGLTAR